MYALYHRGMCVQVQDID